MNESCVIQREDVTAEIYVTLFALQLRQYEDAGEALIYFLSFRYYKTFQKKSEEHHQFLRALDVHNDLLSPALLDRVGMWSVMSTGLPKEEVFEEEPSDR